MATSGSRAFTLDLAEIMEEAYERCGQELRTGYDYATCRRSLNLLMLEWQNKGLNLWTVKNGSTPLVAGVTSYSLPADQIDIVEALIRTNEGDTTSQTDFHIKRVSISNYTRQTNKLLRGKPTMFWVERGINQITLHLWPVPDGAQEYSLNYYYIQRIEDTGEPASLTMAVDDRYLPPLISGLAYYLSMKKAPDRTSGLKSLYDEQWEMASDAAREKASFFLKPGGGYDRL